MALKKNVPVILFVILLNVFGDVKFHSLVSVSAALLQIIKLLLKGGGLSFLT